MAEVELSTEGVTVLPGWGSLRPPGVNATEGRRPGPGGWRPIDHVGADTDWVAGTWQSDGQPAAVEFRSVDGVMSARTVE